jgi:hypothetical protein
MASADEDEIRFSSQLKEIYISGCSTEVIELVEKLKKIGVIVYNSQRID